MYGAGDTGIISTYDAFRDLAKALMILFIGEVCHDLGGHYALIDCGWRDNVCRHDLALFIHNIVVNQQSSRCFGCRCSDTSVGLFQSRSQGL